MLNTALLGAGRIAGVHATAISTHPGSRLVAVSDINAEGAAKLAAQYGAQARTTDAILADPTINAVLIATSNRFSVCGPRCLPPKEGSGSPSSILTPQSAPHFLRAG